MLSAQGQASSCPEGGLLLPLFLKGPLAPKPAKSYPSSTCQGLWTGCKGGEGACLPACLQHPMRMEE